MGKARPLAIIHVKFCNFSVVREPEFLLQNPRLLHLLEHHFNYIHKGRIRQVLFTQRFCLDFYELWITKLVYVILSTICG